MKRLAILILMFATPAFAVDNQPIIECQKLYGYKGLHGTSTPSWSNIATCIDNARNKKRFQQEDEIWEYIQKNPHYRYPGMALPNGAQRPLDKCWGLPRKNGTQC